MKVKVYYDKQLDLLSAEDPKGDMYLARVEPIIDESGIYPCTPVGPGFQLSCSNAKEFTRFELIGKL